MGVRFLPALALVLVAGCLAPVQQGFWFEAVAAAPCEPGTLSADGARLLPGMGGRFGGLAEVLANATRVRQHVTMPEGEAFYSLWGALEGVGCRSGGDWVFRYNGTLYGVENDPVP